MIHKLLKISLKHLPRELAGHRGLSEVDSVDVDQVDLGWLMDVPADVDGHWANGDFWEPPPPVVVNIQRYAREHNCDYVMFVPDGPTVPELELFDYETVWDWLAALKAQGAGGPQVWQAPSGIVLPDDPKLIDGLHRLPQRCDAPARTGVGVCQQPLDAHGNCTDASHHLEGQTHG